MTTNKDRLNTLADEMMVQLAGEFGALAGLAKMKTKNAIANLTEEEAAQLVERIKQIINAT